MADQDLPPGVEYTNYLSRPATPPSIPRSTPTPTPTATPAISQNEVPGYKAGDTSSAIQRALEAGRRLAATPTATPFIDRSKALQERAQTGLRNLIGETSTANPVVPPNPNIIAARTGVLDQAVNAAQVQKAAATAIPQPTLAPIKPGAQLNSFLAPKVNPTPTPSSISTADKLPSLIDARFANTQTGVPQ